MSVNLILFRNIHGGKKLEGMENVGCLHYYDNRTNDTKFNSELDIESVNVNPIHVHKMMRNTKIGFFKKKIKKRK